MIVLLWLFESAGFHCNQPSLRAEPIDADYRLLHMLLKNLRYNASIFSRILQWPFI